LAAVGECGGVFAGAVVGGAPRGEVQLAGLASSPFFREVCQQRGDCSRGQGLTEEIGLDNWVLVLRRLLWLILIRPFGGAEGRPEARRLLTGHVLAKVCCRVGPC